MDRLAQLKKFIEEDPGDPFNFYVLALEFQKTDPLQAGRLFEELVNNHPGYLPTYYPYAHLLIEFRDYINAEKIFLQGIETARNCNDFKTMRELQAACADWKNEME